jgi:catechol 2,3-dioxygenase-like lactoylglutathione lyase family enzyme
MTAAAHIVAPQGSPLAFAVISCERLESSLDFYCDRIGLDAGRVIDWRGTQFERLWSLPPGARARACMLGVGVGDGAVGRILLLDFDAASLPPRLAREPIQRDAHSRVIGLANLNFYARDLRASVRQFAAQGHAVWSDPTQHSLDERVGNPIEVIFDGPDHVAINLVELTSRDPATRIGQMRAYVEQHGYTSEGFTPVVTTSHVVRSLDAARSFYERVLGMGVLIDDELRAPHVNAFLRLPSDGVTHIQFMQGGHMFGKIALSEPRNYLERCEDLRPRARAPNIGYLAQAFEVDDLDAAARKCATLGVEAAGERAVMDIPGLGPREQLLVRNPGSGALQWLLARG